MVCIGCYMGMWIGMYYFLRVGLRECFFKIQSKNYRNFRILEVHHVEWVKDCTEGVHPVWVWGT